MPLALARDRACSAGTSLRRPAPPAAGRRGRRSGWETARGTRRRPARIASAQLRLVVGEIEERTSTTRIPAPETASASPDRAAASAVIARSTAGRRAAGAGGGRRRNWPPDRGSRDSSRTRAAGDRAPACRAAASASSTTAPDRGSRTRAHEISSCARALVIAIVRLAPAGQRDHRRMVRIVVPQRVDAVAARRRRRGRDCVSCGSFSATM